MQKNKKQILGRSMSLIIEKIRIPQERHLQKHMEGSLGAELIGELLGYKDRYGGEERDKGNRQAKAENFPLTRSSGGHIYRMCKDVQKKLGLEKLKIAYFLSHNPEFNSAADFSYHPDTPHKVIINSGLVEQLEDERELRFVVGHEIGHLLSGIPFTRVFRFIYPEFNNVPRFLRGTYDLWRKLNEISCDRVGFLVVGDLEAALRAQFRLYSGIDMNRLRIAPERFAATVNKLVKEIPETAGSEFNTHPISPLRTKALTIFGQSKTWKALQSGRPIPKKDKVLEEGTAKIAEQLSISPHREIDRASLDFLGAAGYKVMVSDGPATREEYIYLLNRLAQYTFWPKDQVDAALKKKGGDIDKILSDSARYISRNHPAVGKDLVYNLIELILSDRRLHRKELDILFDIAEKRMKIPHREVVDLVLQCVGERFCPLK